MRSHEAANFSFLHKETVYMRLVFVFFLHLKLRSVTLQKIIINKRSAIVGRRFRSVELGCIVVCDLLHIYMCMYLCA